MAPLPSDPALEDQQQHLVNNAADVPTQLGTGFEIPKPTTAHPVVAKLFGQRSHRSKIGDTICSRKICKVAENGNAESDVAPAVYLGMYPRDLAPDLRSSPPPT